MKFRVDLKIILFLILFYITNQMKIYLIIMAFALLHELAHLVVGIILKFKPQEMELMPFGFYITLGAKIEDYNKHILKSNMVQLKYIFVAIAGPLLNFILIIILSYTNLKLKQEMIYANLILLLLNLIPIYPLDGGRIVQSIFRFFFGKKTANKSINILNNTCIVLLTIASSIAILYFKNIAILFILVYLWDIVIRENKKFELEDRIVKT